MENSEIVDKLESFNKVLNGVIGRLTIYAVGPGKKQELSEAHTMLLDLGADVDELINQLL